MKNLLNKVAITVTTLGADTVGIIAFEILNKLS